MDWFSGHGVRLLVPTWVAGHGVRLLVPVWWWDDVPDPMSRQVTGTMFLTPCPVRPPPLLLVHLECVGKCIVVVCLVQVLGFLWSRRCSIRARDLLHTGLGHPWHAPILLINP